MKTGERDEDNRTNAKLANDIGLSEATLMSLSNIDPQRTSLRIFNTLFPTNQDKVTLNSISHLTEDYPDLLKNILGKLPYKSFFS
jgi:hypothetical protein